MHMSTRRRQVTRLVGFSALMPQLLLFWASRIQSRTLYQYGNQGTLPLGRLMLSWGIVLMDILWTCG